MLDLIVKHASRRACLGRGALSWRDVHGRRVAGTAGARSPARRQAGGAFTVLGAAARIPPMTRTTAAAIPAMDPNSAPKSPTT